LEAGAADARTRRYCADRSTDLVGGYFRGHGGAIMQGSQNFGGGDAGSSERAQKRKWLSCVHRTVGNFLWKTCAGGAQLRIENMTQAAGNHYPAGQDAKLRAGPMRMAPIASGDPTIVSLTAVELRPLLDIEAAAETALQAINRPSSPDTRELLAAAQALDVALHMPVFGG
jgi:hypothetical protein